MRKVKLIDRITSAITKIKVGSIITLYTEDEARKISPEYFEIQGDTVTTPDIVGFIVDDPDTAMNALLWMEDEDFEELEEEENEDS